MDALFQQALQQPVPQISQPAEGAEPVPAEPQATETIEPTKTQSSTSQE